MRRRPFPALAREVGEVGIALHDEPTRWPLPALVAVLRRARALGVDVIDLSNASDVPATELALSHAFPSAADAPMVVLPAVRSETPGGPGVDLREDLAGQPWEEDRARLHLERLDLLMLVDPPGGPALRAAARRLDHEVAQGKLRAWGVEWSRVDAAREGIPEAVDLGAKVVAAPYHLLDPRALADHLPRLGARGVSLMVEDPFARGRLDGSLLRDGPLGGPGLPRPPEIDDLHRRFDPVVRLGFLTRGGGRTLAQAALQMALRPREVALAVVPISPPELLATYADLGKVPELTDGEWDEWERTVRS